MAKFRLNEKNISDDDFVTLSEAHSISKGKGLPYSKQTIARHCKEIGIVEQHFGKGSMIVIRLKPFYQWITGKVTYEEVKTTFKEFRKLNKRKHAKKYPKSRR